MWQGRPTLCSMCLVMPRTPYPLCCPSPQLVESLGEGQVLKKNSTWVPSSSGPPYQEENTGESCGPAAAGQVSGIHSSNPELEL